MNITLPDGSIVSLPDSARVRDLALAIGGDLAKAALAAKANGRMVGVGHPLRDGDSVEIITADSPEALGLLRHSAAHIMAAAVAELFPGSQFGVGPDIDDGFYYDIAAPRQLSTDDFAAIEAKMHEIVATGAAFERGVVTPDEARALFSTQPLKLELIDELPEGETITTYRLGDFLDLCRGPHLPDASYLPAFKLTKLAGAYWRGDAERQQLQRLYGTAWFSQADQDAYLTRIEEAEKRDHRKLGRELGIYITDDRAGVGLPI